MSGKSIILGLALMVLAAAPGMAAVQYSNNFDNPSSPVVNTAWPEWVDMSTGGPVAAQNGRLEWTGGSNHWLRLDKELPLEYTVEFDFFYQNDVVGRFSFWPLVGADASTGNGIFTRHNYFLRQTTHYFNGSNTVPSEGPCDLTLPLGSNPHRIRAEVSGDHILLMYKKLGEGGWILIDQRDFPPFGDGPRYIQLGYNLDSAPAGLIYVDNLAVSYKEVSTFSYSNTFDNPSNIAPSTAWPELVDMSTGGPVYAQNGRIEWTGGSNHWLRLDKQLPNDYVVEFDFFYQNDIVGRFSFWPLVGADASTGNGIFTRHNYFLRQTTHYFNGSNTVPSEGPCDLTLPLGSKPHRIRAEVSGDHILLMYKNLGEGGWILVDQRDFPAFGDGPRYVQFGYNLDSAPPGLIYVDNLSIRGLAANRATINRDITVDNFEANKPILVKLPVTVSGTIASLNVVEGYPKIWKVTDISNGGAANDGTIVWDLSNLSQSLTLTYTITPPRLIQSRVENFSGVFGEDQDRIGGDSSISILLPYIYREAVDYDFSGSPVNSKNYPTEGELGAHYAKGMVGVPSSVLYKRSTADNSTPAFDSEFAFPANADFHETNLTGTRGGSYDLDDYRDNDTVALEHRGDATSIGRGISAGDWWRYTFDLGAGDQVLYLNLSINTGWDYTGPSLVDIYVDNKFKGEIYAPDTRGFDLFKIYSVGPFPVSGGVHSIVVAFPDLPAGYHDCAGFERLEVVRVSGVGRVSRQLTQDGFFKPSQAFTVSLKTDVIYGSYKPFMEEFLPPGLIVTNISDGGQLLDNSILWDISAITASKTVTYTITSPEGLKFILFNGLADIGLPLADVIHGDSSVVNQVWLFGKDPQSQKDDFNGSAVASPWVVEYGSDASLNTNYKEGVTLALANGILTFGADTMSMADKFNEWSNGRRAPMILRTDVPTGDWRMETKYNLAETFTWTDFNVGLFAAYNAANDANVSGDEYLFGFNADDMRVELTNVGSLGVLNYHQFTDELDWLNAVAAGDVNAVIAVTRRGDELIFSAQLPGRSWQLVGAPVTEKRQATRIGLFTKISGSENYSLAEFDYFTLSQFEVFVDVADWPLY
ncbi:MAG: hypothetical protein AB1656_26835 [Candidatus Omnitrophota bacterium]